MFSIFNMRTLKAFASAPIIPPPPPYAVVPMATFRTYATKAERSNAGSNKHTEQTSPGSPTTDDIAHSDAAYGGAGANPKESARKIQNEKPGTMGATAANPKVSKPPKGGSSETDIRSPTKEDH